MAERRMFAKSIVLSDVFIDMPATARCLYFTLGMLADDDGFIGNPRAIMRQIGSSDDDIKVLLSKRYLLSFESGVIVIKHWRMNNYLQNDRHHKTTYVEELGTLTTDDKGAYTEKNKENKMYTNCIQNVYMNQDNDGSHSEKSEQNQVYTKCIQDVYIGKDSIDKDRVDKISNCDSQLSININKGDENKNSNDDKKDKVAEALMKYIPSANSIWLEKIDKFRSRNLPDELIIKAIENTALANTRDCRYFMAICEEYIVKGYKSVAEVDEAEKSYSYKKNKNKAHPEPMKRDAYNEWFEKTFLKK